jgi:hypothetical protein
MKLSTRYAGWVLLLLLLPAPAVILHSYLDATSDDGRRISFLPAQLDGQTGRPTTRNPGWGGQIFGTDDWIEREYSGGDGHSLRLFAARGYDPKRLYHHPELAVLYGKDLAALGVEALPGDPSVPVHWLGARNGQGLAGYALHYDGAFVADPISFQLKNAFELLFTPRKTMTILLVWDPAARGTDAAARAGVATLLQAATTAWNTAHRPPAGQ